MHRLVGRKIYIPDVCNTIREAVFNGKRYDMIIVRASHSETIESPIELGGWRRIWGE